MFPRITKTISLITVIVLGFVQQEVDCKCFETEHWCDAEDWGDSRKCLIKLARQSSDDFCVIQKRTNNDGSIQLKALAPGKYLKEREICSYTHDLFNDEFYICYTNLCNFFSSVPQVDQIPFLTCDEIQEIYNPKPKTSQENEQSSQDNDSQSETSNDTVSGQDENWDPQNESNNGSSVDSNATDSATDGSQSDTTSQSTASARRFQSAVTKLPLIVIHSNDEGTEEMETESFFRVVLGAPEMCPRNYSEFFDNIMPLTFQETADMCPSVNYDILHLIMDNCDRDVFEFRFADNLLIDEMFFYCGLEIVAPDEEDYEDENEEESRLKNLEDEDSGNFFSNLFEWIFG